MKHYSTSDVARLAGIKAYRITYAISVGLIPDPKMRIAGKRCFSSSDLSKIKKHFRAVSKSANESETSDAFQK